MLKVLTLEEADALLASHFSSQLATESVPLESALRRVLREDLTASEDLPAFTRSTVDGYALRACDSFGCSESLPALLRLIGSVPMGEVPKLCITPDTCAYVPTGGALPEGADAMVMLEYAEAFGDHMAIQKPAAPGQYLILRGDDAKAGTVVLSRGRRLRTADIGSAAALGYAELCVSARPRVSIISTGDEIVPVAQTPSIGQIRDINGPMLRSMAASCGAEAAYFGIVADEEERLLSAVEAAAQTSDLVLLSGGSSAGSKDAAERVIKRLGTLLFHGLALKPGKPALAGDIGGVPVIGLPGHPLAAYTVFHVLVRPLLCRMQGAQAEDICLPAVLICKLPSNHGREELVPVYTEGGRCMPLISKSGLVTTLAGSCGYIRVPRDCEGLDAGTAVEVHLWETL